MFNMLVNFIFYILTKISSLIFTPIQMALTGVFPSLDTLIDNVQYFLNTYIFNTLQWFKMFCINTLAFPTELFSFLVSCFTILISLHASMILYKGVLTIYQKLKP